MTENITFNNPDIWTEIVDRGRAEGVTDQEAFNALVGQILTDHLDVGEMTYGQNFESISESFQSRFPEYQKEISAD